MNSESRQRPFRRRLFIQVAFWIRWSHIYASMLGLAVTLFFSVTGITLNHPEWFPETTVSLDPVEGKLDPQWLDPSRANKVEKLEIVEFFRRQHGVTGLVADFRVEDDECLLTFKGPGHAADAVIDRATGRYMLNQVKHGFVAWINDLHKGRDTGPVWSILIDVSAVLLTLISTTGILLILYLKMRRKPGLLVMTIGALISCVVLWLGIS